MRFNNNFIGYSPDVQFEYFSGSDTLEVFNNNLKNVLNEKFLYLPLSESGRVSQTKYFKTEKNHFTLSEKLIDEQNKKINEIIKKYNGI